MSPVHVPAAWVLTGPLPLVDPPPPVELQGVPLKFPFCAPGEPFAAALAPQLARTELSLAKSFNSHDFPPPSTSASPSTRSKSTESRTLPFESLITRFPPLFPNIVLADDPALFSLIRMTGTVKFLYAV